MITKLVEGAFRRANRNGYYFYIMEPIEIAYDMADYDSDISEWVLSNSGDIDNDKFEQLTGVIQNYLEGYRLNV